MYRNFTYSNCRLFPPRTPVERIPYRNGNAYVSLIHLCLGGIYGVLLFATSLTHCYSSNTDANMSNIGANVSYIDVNMSNIDVKNSYIGVKNPYIDANMSHIGVENSYIGVKNSYIRVDMPYIGVKNSYIDVDMPHIGVENPHIGANISHIGANIPNIGHEISFINHNSRISCTDHQNLCAPAASIYHSSIENASWDSHLCLNRYHIFSCRYRNSEIKKQFITKNLC
jgi:hypothetical protein